MAKPIEIKLDAETSGAEAGSERVADGLGKVEDALDRVTDAGQEDTRALDKVARSADDAASAMSDLDRATDDADRSLSDVDRSLSDVDRSGDDAARSLDKITDSADEAADAGRDLDRDLTKALDDVADEARKAGDDIGDGIKDGTDRAGEGLNDFKDEAAGTAREGAASFTGEWDDVGDIVQETLANALGGFGPIGAAFGIAAAAGFGVLYGKVTENAEQAEERISSMYEDMLESQSTYLSKSYILDELQKIASGADDAIIGYEDLQAIADEAGVSLEAAARAYIGGGEDLNALLDQTSERVKRNTDLQTTGDLLALQGNNENTRALRDRQKEIDEAADRMGKFNELGGRKLHKEVEIDDNGTARDTQRKINGIKGKDVPVGVYVSQSSIDGIYNTIDGIRLPAIVVQARLGQAAV